MKKILFINPKHVDEFIKCHKDDTCYTKYGKQKTYTFTKSAEFKEPRDNNHWHCHLKIEE